MVAWEPLVCNNSHKCPLLLMIDGETYRSVHMALKKVKRKDTERILIIGSADLLALSEKEIQAAQGRKAEGPSVSRCSKFSWRECGNDGEKERVSIR